MSGDVTLTDAERLAWIEALHQSRERGIGPIYEVAESQLADRLAAERERIAQAIETVPCTRDHVHLRTRFARIARGDAPPAKPSPLDLDRPTHPDLR